MTHYVLMKFVPGADLNTIEARIRATYAELDAALPYLHQPQILLNCVERDSNADLMVCLNLDSPEDLQPYLTHPLHLQMAQDLKNQIVARTSFDHM